MSRPRFRCRGAQLAAATLVILSLAPLARAHPLAPSLLELRQGQAGDWSVLWKTPLIAPMGDDPQPLLPSSCGGTSEPQATRDADSLRVTWTIRCDEAPAGARFGIEGLSGDAAGLLRLVRTDGSTRSWLLGRERPVVDVAIASRSTLATVGIALGLQSVAAVPTLAVLLALLLLFRRGSVALCAIAFVLGQSLALAALSMLSVSLPAFWLPIATALALLLIGARLIGDGDSWKRDRWLAALALGLSQGAILAAALSESPLDSRLPIVGLAFGGAALLSEIAVVGVFTSTAAALRAIGHRSRHELRTLPAYAIGAWATFFILERLASLP